MTNLIPPWIATALVDNQRGGRFTAESLFLDISGFTAMTESLMLHGKDGAEALSKVINEVFDPVLAEIEAGGGWVTTFAGDAFTALFPLGNQNSSTLLQTSLRILNVFQRQPDRKTPWGDFALQAKVGLGYGDVEWGILGQDGSLGYYFRGPAVDLAAGAEHHCLPGTLAWGHSLSLTAPEGAVSVETVAGHTVVRPGLFPFSERPSSATLAKLPADLVSRFLPIEKFPDTPGEFRNLSSVFLIFDEGARPLEEIHRVLNQRAQETGGFFNLLDFGDKGGIALVLFGAPVSLEANLERAADFGLSVVRSLPEVRVGIAQGQCFAGYVGSPLRLTYTALGQVVNLSARLATSADSGEVLVPKQALENLAAYRFRDLGERTFKGFARPVPTVCLVEKDDAVLQYSLPRGVGRTVELDQLTRWFKEVAQDGKRGAFLVQGEAGLGKTQLAADGLLLTPEVTYQILSCDPVFPQGFNPFRGVFAGLLGPAPHAVETELARIQALVNGLLTPQTPDYLDHEIRRAGKALLHLAGLELHDPEWEGLDPQARHDRTIEALVAFWSLQAQNKPLILVVENAQALDKDTAEFLERVLSRDASLPLGVLLLSRGSVPLKLAHGIETLVLEPFSTQDSILLVRQTLGADPTERLLELLARRTSRIPLYLAELLRYLKENRMVKIVEKHEADFVGEQETGLPRSLEDLILSQVDHLPGALKSALPLLAVLGNNFAETVASALLGKNADSVLQEAQRQGILRRGNDGTLAFQKEFLRESVYQLQLGDQLRDLHLQCALVLESVFPDPKRSPGAKAYHFDRAQDFGRARDYFRREAEESTGEFRNREALTAFDRYLELSVDNRENSLVRLEKARILEHVGDWKAARVELERGIGLAALSGQEEQYHRFFAFLGQIQFKQGDSAGARASLEKAIRDPRSGTLGPELVQSRIDLARVHLLGGQYGEALGRLLEAKDLAVEQKFAEEEGLALYYLGVVYRVRNRKAEAIATYQKSLEIFRGLGKDRLIAYPLYDLSLMFQHEGELEQAKTYMTEAYRIYTQIGYKSGLGAALLNLGAIEDQRGNFEAAMDAFRRSRNITEELGEDLGTAYALFSLGASAYKQREYPRALTALTDAHVMIERLGAESYKGYTLSYLASVLVKLGRADDVVSHVRRQLEVIAKIGDDVEKGRVFLAMAELLASSIPLSAQGEKDLQDVVALSGAPKASASWFYQTAIRSAREANYINTLIPATYEYGVYLLSKGKFELAEKAIRQAWARATKGGWTVYARRLEAKHSDILRFSPLKEIA